MRRIRTRPVACRDLTFEGFVGLGGISPFEGNGGVSQTCLRTAGFGPNSIQSLCPSRLLCVRLDFTVSDGSKASGLGWLHWLPNRLLFLIAFRVAVLQSPPNLTVEALV